MYHGRRSTRKVMSAAQAAYSDFFRSPPAYEVEQLGWCKNTVASLEDSKLLQKRMLAARSLRVP
jgi:hypothetical protein